VGGILRPAVIEAELFFVNLERSFRHRESAAWIATSEPQTRKVTSGAICVGMLGAKRPRGSPAPAQRGAAP
jgi:hypothetical protein